MPIDISTLRELDEFLHAPLQRVSPPDLAAGHKRPAAKVVGPLSKRQNLGTEGNNEAVEEDELDSNEDSDADSDEDSDEEFYRLERNEQAMSCECISCSEPHPDPDQLIEDNPSTRAADLPSARDTNGWRVCSDDWSRGICPDCKDEVGLGDSSSEEDESEEDEDEDNDDDDDAERKEFKKFVNRSSKAFMRSQVRVRTLA